MAEADIETRRTREPGRPEVNGLDSTLDGLREQHAGRQGPHNNYNNIAQADIEIRLTREPRQPGLLPSVDDTTLDALREEHAGQQVTRNNNNKAQTLLLTAASKSPGAIRNGEQGAPVGIAAGTPHSEQQVAALIKFERTGPLVERDPLIGLGIPAQTNVPGLTLPDKLDATSFARLLSKVGPNEPGVAEALSFRRQATILYEGMQATAVWERERAAKVLQNAGLLRKGDGGGVDPFAIEASKLKLPNACPPRMLAAIKSLMVSGVVLDKLAYEDAALPFRAAMDHARESLHDPLAKLAYNYSRAVYRGEDTSTLERALLAHKEKLGDQGSPSTNALGVQNLQREAKHLRIERLGALFDALHGSEVEMYRTLLGENGDDLQIEDVLSKNRLIIGPDRALVRSCTMVYKGHLAEVDMKFAIASTDGMRSAVNWPCGSLKGNLFNHGAPGTSLIDIMKREEAWQATGPIIRAENELQNRK